MHLEVDMDSPTPIFQQLADQLRLRIAAGELKVGDTLPSVRRIAKLLRINLNTVAKAYRILAEEKLVDLQHGRAARVRARVGVSRKALTEDATRELEAWVAKARTQGLDDAYLQRIFARALEKTKGGR